MTCKWKCSILFAACANRTAQ